MKETSNEKKKSIKKRFLMVIIPPIMLSLIVLIGVNYMVARGIIIKMTGESLIATSKSSVNEINGWYNEIIAELTSVKRTIDQVNLTPEQEERYVKTTNQINEYIPTGVYIGAENNQFIDGSGWIPGADYVVKERDWFIEGKANTEVRFGKPYVDKESGQYIVSATAKLEKTVAGATRVMAADVNLADMSNMIASMSLGEGGSGFIIEKDSYAILADYDETLVATHLNDETQSMLYKNIYEVIQAGTTGITLIKSSGENYIVNIEPVTNENWLHISAIPQSEAVKDLLVLQWALIGLAVVIIIAVLILIERTAHLMIKPINGLTATIGSITEGNFNVVVNTLRNDEIGIMNNGIKGFVGKMREIIESNIHTAKKLNEEAQKNTEAAAILYGSSEEQAYAMKELNTTVDELSKSVYEIAENATQLAQLVSITKEDGEKTSSTMQEVVVASVEGKQNMNQVIDSMENITASVMHLAEVVTEVEKEMVHINGIIEVIGQIADETNLLSLNASIEAARSGEAGKGFAVVASQIGKLAENSAQAVVNIAGIIKEVNELVKDTKVKTEEGIAVIKESGQAVNITSANFDKIYEMVNKADQVVQHMIEEVNQVDEVSSNLAAISEEQAASGEEIAQTSENLLLSTEEVKRYSKQLEEGASTLRETAKTMNKNMEFFKI